MHSYKRFLVSVSAAMLLICMFSGFSHSNDQGELKKLLDLRSEILQQAYYKELELNEAIKKLGEIETQPLLSEDVAGLLENIPCQIDRIKRMEFVEFDKGTGLAPYSTYKVKISWYMAGPEGDYVSCESYHIVVKTVNQRAKISTFEPEQIL